MGLVLTGDETKPDYAKLVQDCNRFLLNHLTQDLTKSLAPHFATKTSAVSRCHACGHEQARPLDTLFVDMVYPADEPLRAAPPTFTGLLHASMVRETETKAWCEQCQLYKPALSRRVVQALPDILAVGCQARTASELGLWHAEDDIEGTFVPEAITATATDGSLTIARAGTY